MATTNDDEEGSCKVFKLLLQSCSDLFFPFLTNRELALLDRIITDISLRKLFFQQADQFYLKNKFKSLNELTWVMKRGFVITKCHLDFDFDGKI